MITMTLADFLGRAVHEQEPLIGDWCRSRTTTLVSGEPGAGKSFFVQTLALAAVSGREAFRWKPAGRIKVGLFDYENDDAILQERLNKLIVGFGINESIGDHLQIATRSLCEERLKVSGLMSLSEKKDRDFLLQEFTDCQLLIVDNVNACFDMPDENSTKGWAPVQEFIFEVRKQNMALILVHHTPKSNPGAPAGSSKNERAFDYSLVLSKPLGVINGDGAAFDLRIRKRRGNPRDLSEFSAVLREQDEQLVWKVGESSLNQAERSNQQQRDTVLALKAQGASVRKIEAETGIPKSTVQRLFSVG